MRAAIVAAPHRLHMVVTVQQQLWTTGQSDVRDITGDVGAVVVGSELASGIVTVSVVGSTASVSCR